MHKALPRIHVHVHTLWKPCVTLAFITTLTVEKSILLNCELCRTLTKTPLMVYKTRQKLALRGPMNTFLGKHGKANWNNRTHAIVAGKFCCCGAFCDERTRGMPLFLSKYSRNVLQWFFWYYKFATEGKVSPAPSKKENDFNVINVSCLNDLLDNRSKFTEQIARLQAHPIESKKITAQDRKWSLVQKHW